MNFNTLRAKILFKSRKKKRGKIFATFLSCKSIYFHDPNYYHFSNSL